MHPQDTTCNWESEEFEYDCSGETCSAEDVGQFLVVLVLLVLILVLLALCKMCNNEKEKLERLRASAERIRRATDSIDMDLETVKHVKERKPPQAIWI